MRGPLKSPEAILALKVCDPAMGSGAFLVQACRYLADRLVDSWDRLAMEQPDRTLTMPYGKPLNGGPREMVLPESHDEAVMWARRFVAEHCLYGVDLNPLAVELAKMSLWLITLSKDKPFEFFDHKLKHGNSLIGCWTADLERYPAAAWDRKGAEGAVKEALKQIKKDAKTQADRQAKDRAKGIVPLIGVDVAALRAETAAEMREIDEVSTFDPQQKERLYRRNIEQDGRYQALKRMFDTWCALWFWPLQGGEMSADLPLAFAYPELLGHTLGAERLMADPERLERWAETVRELWGKERFFHWELEFPEVFEEGRGGFDAAMGNPPYIRIHHLVSYAPAQAEYVQRVYSTAQFGKIDLYVAFVEAGLKLLGPSGVLGFIVPSKFLQADYGIGLRRLLTEECTVTGLVDFNVAQVFVGATIYSCLLFASPSRRQDFDVYMNSENLEARRFLRELDRARFTVTGVSEGPWVLLPGREQRLFEKLSRSGPALANVADQMITGVKTGANHVFVVEPEEVAALPSLQEADRLPSFVKLFAKAEDLKRYRVGTPHRYLIYPYEAVDGSASLIPPKRLSDEAPDLWERLLSHREELEDRQNGAFGGDHWYALSFASSMAMFERSKIVTPTLAPRNSFATEDAGLYFPQGAGGGMGVVFADESASRFTLALLNSSVLSFYVRRTSSRFQSGWYAYEPRFLAQLPIVPYDSPASEGLGPDILRHAVRLERLLKDERTGSELPTDEAIRESDAIIEELVQRLYGLAAEEIRILEEESSTIQ